jgi:hypothetical protein
MGEDPQEALDRAVKDINDMMREAGLLKK